MTSMTSTTAGGTGLGGRHVVVTGGLSGIGRAVVEAMVVEGARVTIFDLLASAREDDTPAAEVCRRIGRDVHYVQGDVSSEGDVQALFASVPPVDVLVNNAAVTTFKPLTELTAQDCDRLLSVNVKGVFLMTRAAVAAWKAEGRPGAIVNVASNLSFVGAPSASLYCASKGAVATFTKAVAAEVGPIGVRVNMVCPGPVETDFNRLYREAGAQAEWEQATPLRMPNASVLADAARVAPSVVFLASDHARHITGASILVDGGANCV